MSLNKGLIEVGREEDVVSRVVEYAIVLECCHIVFVDKVVDGWIGCQRNGDSTGRACCEDYPLGCLWEAVPTARFPVRLALYCKDRAEGFCVLQTHQDFTEDFREYGVILWCGLVDRLLD